MEVKNTVMNKWATWGYEQGKKAGIKEVVDWLFGISTAQEVDFPPQIISFTMLYKEWQAQLKEWGMDK